MTSKGEIAPEAMGTAPRRGRLEGRRILCVGAGTRPSEEADPPPGNGRAIALLAAREGAGVACADLSAEAAQETVDQIEADGGRGVALAGDVRDWAECERMGAVASEALGGLDGLVLNVGTGDGFGLEDTTTEQWDNTFAVNVRGHFQMAKAVVPAFEAGSSIVMMSSTAAQTPSFVPAYDASKGAVESLCRFLASAYASRGVRVNAVAPGAVDTPLGRFYAQASGLESLDDLGLPLGRAATAWEVAYATVFLLSGEAGYITGQRLVVDGGLELNGVHGAGA